MQVLKSAVTVSLELHKKLNNECLTRCEWYKSKFESPLVSQLEKGSTLDRDRLTIY